MASRILYPPSSTFHDPDTCPHPACILFDTLSSVIHDHPLFMCTRLAPCVLKSVRFPPTCCLQTSFRRQTIFRRWHHHRGRLRGRGPGQRCTVEAGQLARISDGHNRNICSPHCVQALFANDVVSQVSPRH